MMMIIMRTTTNDDSCNVHNLLSDSLALCLHCLLSSLGGLWYVNLLFALMLM